MRNRYCSAVGSVSESYISARPLGIAAVTVLWYGRHQSLLSTSLTALSTHPTPPQTPALSHGLRLVWQPPPLLHLYFTSSLNHCALHLQSWFMDPTLRNHSTKTEWERRDKNQFFSSAPASTDHFSVV